MNKLAVLLVAAPLAGCISFGAKPPPMLLRLTPSDTVPVGQTQTASATAAPAAVVTTGSHSLAVSVPPPTSAGTPSITIATPSVPEEIAVTRVPVESGPTSVAYVKNAVWVEPPARLFARLLGDTVTARTGRIVLSTAQSFATGSAQLTGELRHFGIDAGSGAPVAVVTFDATLIRTEGGEIAKQRFEARVPVAAVDAADAGRGLNQAANQVAGQVADWIGR